MSATSEAGKNTKQKDAEHIPFFHKSIALDGFYFKKYPTIFDGAGHDEPLGPEILAKIRRKSSFQLSPKLFSARGAAPATLRVQGHAPTASPRLAVGAPELAPARLPQPFEFNCV